MKKIYIEKDEKYIRIAIKEEEVLVACYIDEEKETPLHGDIYLGTVKNIVPAIKSAFVDIGVGKDCYMYLDAKYKNNNLKKGDYLLVEILKEETKKKGAKVTSLINIPGNSIVVSPYETGIKFSSKIKDENFKKRINSLLKDKSKYGIIIRNSAIDISEEELIKEFNSLCEKTQDILMKKEYHLTPKKLSSDGGVLNRVLRNYLNSYVDEIIVDDKKIFHIIEDKLKESKKISINLKFHQNNIKIFSYYNIEKRLLSLRNNKVVLKSGGNIIIEKTEAMHVIDVNSNKNIKERDMETTAFKTNIEAAKEASREIILRNLSGIIIIDFINMKDEKDKIEVLRVLREGFKDDGTRTVVFNFSPLDLIQISRKKIGNQLSDFIEEEYDKSSDGGKRIKLSYLKLLIKNDIERLSNDNVSKEYVLTVSSIYKNDILKDLENFIAYIGAKIESLYILYEDNYQNYKVEPIIFYSQRKSLEEFKIF